MLTEEKGILRRYFFACRAADGACLPYLDELKTLVELMADVPGEGGAVHAGAASGRTRHRQSVRPDVPTGRKKFVDQLFSASGEEGICSGKTKKLRLAGVLQESKAGGRGVSCVFPYNNVGYLII